MHSVYIFSCQHARTYHAIVMAICMRRRARVRSVIRTGSSAANTPAAANCHPRARRLPFPRRNRYEIKENRRFIGDQRRQRRAIKSACWQGRGGRALTHRRKTNASGLCIVQFSHGHLPCGGFLMPPKPPAEPPADGLRFSPTLQTSRARWWVGAECRGKRTPSNIARALVHIHSEMLYCDTSREFICTATSCGNQLSMKARS
jgi:hypothetical protein